MKELEEIDELVRAVEAIPDGQARAAAGALVESLMNVHAEAFSRLLRVGGSEGFARRAAEDPLIAALLLLYGLHPDDTPSRVAAALDKVRPYLQSHGGEVELAGIDEQTVHVRLRGSCEGCPSSSRTVRGMVEEAIGEAAPEIRAVVVADHEHAAAQARCELCAKPIGAEHRHLADPRARKLVCACEFCALLFPADANLRYKPVPRDIRRLDGFVLTDEQWDALAIPINIAFFLRNAAGNTTALYPGPAGATESLLDLKPWDEIAASNAALARMEPDVEALMINRLRQPYRYYILPIDRCYELVGLIKANWQGISGGDVLETVVPAFFERLA